MHFVSLDLLIIDFLLPIGPDFDLISESLLVDESPLLGIIIFPYDEDCDELGYCFVMFLEKIQHTIQINNLQAHLESFYDRKVIKLIDQLKKNIQDIKTDKEILAYYVDHNLIISSPYTIELCEFLNTRKEFNFYLKKEFGIFYQTCCVEF